MKTAVRPGFSLIELLVVIAIIALLAAMAMGTYFRVRSAQEEKMSERTVAKLNAALNRHWAAARDTADEEFRKNTNGCADALVPFCGGDRDRARSLWMYLRLKNEFPQTFQEARSDIVLKDTTVNPARTVLTLKPKSTFAGLPYPAPVPASVDEAGQQAAVILRLVMDRAGRGETYGDEATGGLRGDLDLYGTKHAIFKDVWGQPLTFVRFAFNAEINAPPFTKGAAGKDPLDPAGRLTAASWKDTTRRPEAIKAVFGSNATATDAWPTGGLNWMFTIVSAGPNKTLESCDLQPSAVGTNGLVPVSDATDDILGYRLRREGE